MPRNMFLFTNANYFLPYTGAGSGVRRALEYDPDVIFSNGINDKEITHSANEFVITIPRKVDPVNDQVAGKTDPAQQKSDQVNDQFAQNTTNLTQKSDQVTEDTTNLKLSKKQKDIRNFCSVP